MEIRAARVASCSTRASSLFSLRWTLFPAIKWQIKHKLHLQTVITPVQLGSLSDRSATLRWGC